jgi:hypothetical protein
MEHLNNQGADMDDNQFIAVAVSAAKAALDALIEWEKLPVRYARTRNGWAGYRGATRLTKFYFSEEGAREAVIALDARDVPVR